MTYNFDDEDRRLGYVKTHWDNYNGVEVNQMHKLFYGDYLTSDNDTTTVLKKVQQTTDIGDKVLENVDVVRTCKQCPVYDQIEQEAQTMENSTISKIGSMDLDPKYVSNLVKAGDT